MDISHVWSMETKNTLPHIVCVVVPLYHQVISGMMITDKYVGK